MKSTRCHYCQGRGWVPVYRTRRTPVYGSAEGFLERVADAESEYLDLSECPVCVGTGVQAAMFAVAA